MGGMGREHGREELPRIIRKLLRVTNTFIISIGVMVSGDINMSKLIKLYTSNMCTSSYVDNTPIKLIFKLLAGHPRCYINAVCCAQSLSPVRLCDTPWTIAHQAPLSRGFSRQEYCSGLPFPPPGDLPNPRIKPRSPALQADPLPSEPPGKPINAVVELFIVIHCLQSLKPFCVVTGAAFIYKARCPFLYAFT